MKAVMKLRTGPGGVEMSDADEPVARPGQILLRVRRAGLCGTDVTLHDWAATIAIGYEPRLPQIMGHEMVGEVLALGDGVEGPPTGTRVAVSPHLTCGRCTYCRLGRSMLCPQRRVLGLDTDGVFATLVAVPAGNVFPLPAGLGWTEAALAEPFTVAVHAIERAAVAPGERVAIVGAGSVALSLLVAVGMTPHGGVVVLGREEDADQLRLAEELGATAVATGPGTIDEALRGLGAEDGVDLVFEAAGQPAAVQTAVRICRPGGRVALVGLPHGPTELETSAIAFAEQQLIGVRAYDVSTWTRSMALMARAGSSLQRLVTHELPLEDFHHAMDLARSRAAVKVLLDPGEA